MLNSLYQKLIRRGKENHDILVKGTIFQHEEVTIINIHAPNTSISNFIKQILMNIKDQININTITAGDLNTSLVIDISTRQKLLTNKYQS